MNSTNSSTNRQGKNFLGRMAKKIRGPKKVAPQDSKASSTPSPNPKPSSTGTTSEVPALLSKRDLSNVSQSSSSTNEVHVSVPASTQDSVIVQQHPNPIENRNVNSENKQEVHTVGEKEALTSVPASVEIPATVQQLSDPIEPRKMNSGTEQQDDILIAENISLGTERNQMEPPEDNGSNGALASTIPPATSHEPERLYEDGMSGSHDWVQQCQHETPKMDEHLIPALAKDHIVTHRKDVEGSHAERPTSESLEAVSTNSGGDCKSPVFGKRAPVGLQVALDSSPRMYGSSSFSRL